MKKFLFLSLAALLVAGVTSCSKDEIDLAKPLEKDTSFFANIQITGSEAMTRALGDYTYNPEEDPNFDPGNANENKINTIYLIFYDKNGDRVSTTQVMSDNNNMKAGEDFDENGNPIVYKGVVQIDVKHGSLMPSYVMAFINPITSSNFEINPDFATLESLQRTTRSRIIDDNGFFAMSKSVYYGTNRVTGGTNEKIVATPLINIEEAGEGKPQQLFNTKESAQAAVDSESGDGVVNIFVERYAAKVNFTLANEAKAPIFDKITGVKLQFIPEYWAVNAYESNTYVTKSFRYINSDEATGSTDYIDLTFQNLNTALGSDNPEVMPWFWNSSARHRCYWAQTPAYYAESYPRVADDITDKIGYAAAGGYALGYYSYNEMVYNSTDPNFPEIARKSRDMSKDDAPIYARENTVAGSSLKAAAADVFASPRAAIASIVMVGHYKLNDKELDDKSYFYVMGNATNGYLFFENTDAMLSYFVKTTVPFALDKNGASTFFDYGKSEFRNDDYKNYFVIEHPKYDVRYGGFEENLEKSLVIDSRFVTIQLNPEKFNTDESGIYALIDGEYVEVTSANFNIVNQQMLYAAGTAQGFQGGKAYFNIPIKHLGFYRKGNKNYIEDGVIKNKNATDKDFDWSAVQSGDFGLVRNHVYSIVVDKIEGLGNGIPNPDDPIVPPTDPEEYFIGARIMVLNWAVVPTQNVTL